MVAIVVRCCFYWLMDDGDGSSALLELWGHHRTICRQCHCGQKAGRWSSLDFISFHFGPMRKVKLTHLVFLLARNTKTAAGSSTRYPFVLDVSMCQSPGGHQLPLPPPQPLSLSAPIQKDALFTVVNFVAVVVCVFP